MKTKRDETSVFRVMDVLCWKEWFLKWQPFLNIPARLSSAVYISIKKLVLSTCSTCEAGSPLKQWPRAQLCKILWKWRCGCRAKYFFAPLVVPLPEDDIFRKKKSKSSNYFYSINRLAEKIPQFLAKARACLIEPPVFWRTRGSNNGAFTRGKKIISKEITAR